MAFTDVGAGNLSLHAGEDSAQASSNRARLEDALGVGDGALRFMRQIHSATVDLAEPRATAADGIRNQPGAEAELEVEADAMVSAGGDVPLAVLAADCMPIVLVGTTGAGGTGAVVSTAVVHAGRRGLLSGVIPAAVNRMRGLGPQQVTGWIGPSVCGKCYEVPAGMAAQAAAALPAVAATTRSGTSAIDLQAGAARQLEDLGVQYDLVGGCTLESNGLFSHRRSNDAGRFAGVVWRAERNRQ